MKMKKIKVKEKKEARKQKMKGTLSLTSERTRATNQRFVVYRKEIEGYEKKDWVTVAIIFPDKFIKILRGEKFKNPEGFFYRKGKKIIFHDNYTNKKFYAPLTKEILNEYKEVAKKLRLLRGDEKQDE